MVDWNHQLNHKCSSYRWIISYSNWIEIDSIYYKLVENDIRTINFNPSTEVWIDVPIDKKIAIHRNKFGLQFSQFVSQQWNLFQKIYINDKIIHNYYYIYWNF